MVKDTQISLRLESDVKDALEKAAKADDRPVAQYLARLIAAHLREKGYLPKPKK